MLGDITVPKHTHIALKSAFGVQHADDEYWYRPLILGDKLFTYVAHIPPGGGVPPYPEAAQRWQIEHSLYVLNGSLKVTLRGESVTLVPHTAIHIPAGEPVEMKNEQEIAATIYMAYTPSFWGSSSPREDRKMVTALAEMRAWYEERGRRIWSPAEMDAMAGDLTARTGTLSEYDRVYRQSQVPTDERDEKPWIALWDADGYRHGHDPHPPDDFWFRHVVSGEKHMTYVGLIPVNGGVPPSPEEAGYVEMSIYTLGGQLGCIILGPDGKEKERFALSPHEAVYAPKYVPLGFFNAGESTASFVLTSTPTRPGRDSISKFHNWATTEAGWKLVSAEFLNKMLGDTLWSFESD
jgi:mannose-6-phosphate isomerase-like protein (cupin superfamily)